LCVALMLPLHCFNVVVQFEFEFFKFEFKLNLFESLAKERKKSLFRPKTPQPAQPFFFSPFLPAQPNPAGPIPSPRPSSRPLSSLPPTGGPHLSGPSPSSRARLGLEPESGHATPRRPSPWRTRQGLPRPLFKRRPTPLGPLRAASRRQRRRRTARSAQSRRIRIRRSRSDPSPGQTRPIPVNPWPFYKRDPRFFKNQPAVHIYSKEIPNRPKTFRISP